MWMCKAIHSTRQQETVVWEANYTGIGIRACWKILKDVFISVDFYEPGVATAISAQASINSGSTGLQWRALFSPRGHETSQLWVGATDGTAGKCQMGKQHVSLSPSLPQKPLAWVTLCCQPRLRCLALCPAPRVLFDIAACAPCPMEDEKSQAAEAVGSATKQGFWPWLSFTSLLSSSSLVAQESQSVTLWYLGKVLDPNTVEPGAVT